VSFLSHLECSGGHITCEPNQLHSVCGKCGGPLLCRYDLEPLAQCRLREEVASRSGGMWRFRELLPVADETSIVTLGEGQTPLLPAEGLAAAIHLREQGLLDADQTVVLFNTASGLKYPQALRAAINA